MVPDKFNMVDMGGIDLIMMQGEEVPGLYDRLVESIAQCRYQCLYNWLFDGVVIPPSYVKMEVNEDDEVEINEGVTVSSDDIIHIYSVEPGPVDPEIIPLLAEENGVYNVPSGKDGFNPVTVDVPSYTPVIESLAITANGNYSAPTGTDGYNPISVNVPSTPPTIQSLSVTENGTYTPPSGVDGYSPVVVNVSGGGNTPLAFHKGRLSINTGEITQSEEYCYSDMIPASTTLGQWFLDVSRSDLSSYYTGVIIYESDGTTIADYIRQYSAYRSFNGGSSNGRYFRVAAKIADLSFLNLAYVTGQVFIVGSNAEILETNLIS